MSEEQEILERLEDRLKVALDCAHNLQYDSLDPVYKNEICANLFLLLKASQELLREVWK